ncbi:MAG TPA: DUF5687 family protein [Puia sp.]|nr:DUF5687 family protein [Puia sp.]
MILTLLSHQWKAFWRSRSAGKNLATQLVIGFLALYLLACALFLGFSFRHLLPELFPAQNIIKAFCGLILYYFMVDILTRFLVQELPVLAVQPYLAQDIRRRQLVRFLNLRSIFHFLNLLPIFIFIPFVITVIGPAYGPLAAACLVVAILAAILFNHFLVLYVKRQTIINSWWLVGLLGAVGILITLDHFHVFSISALSTALFTTLLKYPALTIAFIFLAYCSFLNNSLFLLHNLYFEEITRRGRRRQSAEYAWLQQWGLAGELVGLNLRLILRNKRARSVVLFSFVILLYGFIFYKPEFLKQAHTPFILMGALFITGVFIMNFGQFLFAWHSSYFDSLMSLPVSIPVFIRSQFLMFIAVSTISFVIASLYGLISWKVIPFQFAAWLYNIGINSVVVVFFATRNYKAIDLAKSASFNYQGTGLTQWLNVLAFLLFPLLLFTGLSYLFNLWVCVAIIGALGLVSLLLQNWWIGILTRQLQLRKHLILSGFREK